VVEHLPAKHKALNSNPNNEGREEGRKERERKERKKENSHLVLRLQLAGPWSKRMSTRLRLRMNSGCHWEIRVPPAALAQKVLCP
jgi:hypothetical protein